MVGGQRVATVLIYLEDVEEGGCTLFACGRDREAPPVAVKPQRGSAVVFLNVHPLGAVDERTLHAGAPLTSPTARKYCLAAWVRDRLVVISVDPGSSVGGGIRGE